MDQQINLIPLRCIRCNIPLPAGEDEVAWVCANCGQGMTLDESIGLVEQEVLYSVGLPVNAIGKPYWVLEGKVSLQRVTFGSFGKVNEDAQRYWSQPRLFFIPAYSISFEDLLNTSQEYLRNPVLLESGAPARFEPVTRSLDEVRPAAEFVVVAVEAGRPDKLKEIQFELQLGIPTLWILP